MSIPGFISLSDTSPQHNEMHRKLFRNTLYFLPDVVTIVPNVDTLPSGVAVVYEDTATNTRRLYINVNNNIFYLEGKNV